MQLTWVLREPDAGLGYCGCPKKPAVKGGLEGLDSRTAPECESGAGGDFQFGADVHGDLGDVVIDEMAEAMVGNAAKPSPFAEGAEGRFFTGGENPAGAEADDVGELRADAGRGNGGWVHTHKTGCQRGVAKKPARV